jgi:hypothetical protein
MTEAKLSIEALISQVRNAKSKDTLEALVLTELGIDIDKRLPMKDLQAEVLAGLGADAEPAAPVAQPEAPVAAVASIEGEITPELPELGDEQEQAPKPQTRLIQNTVSGRVLVWTPELQKLSYMKEV